MFYWCVGFVSGYIWCVILGDYVRDVLIWVNRINVRMYW